MKTRILTLGLAMTSFCLFSQQQIGNSGFENWDNVGTNNEEPTNWSSFMTASGGLSGFASQQIEQSTDAHTGTYSCKIYSTSTFGVIANGNVTVGQVNMGSTTPNNPDNYNITRTADPDFHQVLTDEPDSLVFWAKYTPVDANDSARVSATIHDNYDYRDPEDAASSNEIVAKAVSNFPTTSTQWKRFSFPFDYASFTGNNKVAEYILITYTTNKVPGGGSANDVLLIDDVELIYNIPEVNITPATAQSIMVNDPGNVLTANESPTAASSREWKYTTTSGSGYQSFTPIESGLTYTPQFATSGTYYVIVESTINGTLVTSNEVEITVYDQPEVTITPGSSQSILINENGTELTANETPAGTSREWKFSTTSGSGYQSFASPETALTYTPNFANQGSYYIIVQSVISGSTYTSNEVLIEVSEPVSINETTWAPIQVYAYGQQITININENKWDQGSFTLYNSQGQEVQKTMIQQEMTTITAPTTNGIYFYRISDGKQSSRGQLYIQSK